MKTPTKEINTQELARQYAIDWQSWQAEQSLSYRELSDWQGVLFALGEKYNLLKEFKENGII